MMRHKLMPFFDVVKQFCYNVVPFVTAKATKRLPSGRVPLFMADCLFYQASFTTFYRQIA